jgi:RNA polymerase sigma factor (sigma-70 family)
VARNRITDRYRRKKIESISEANPVAHDEEEDLTSILDLLPSPDAGPEAIYTRSVLVEEILEALEDLPDEQSAVFIAHEIEGRSFAELAAESGTSINTLLSRKRYAVQHLQRRLRSAYEDFLQ